MMHIMIINHYAGSPMHGMEYRPYYFAREWINEGHSVTIVAANYSHLRSKQPVWQKGISNECIDGIRYVWINTPKYTGNSISRIANMLSFALQIWMKEITIDSPDIVIDSSTYPLTIFSTKRIAKKYNAKLVFEVHDLWPLAPIELGGFSRHHPYIMAMQFAEDYAYKKSHRVVSLLPKAKEYMVSHGMLPDKFIHIPNGVDVSSWKNSNSLPEEHNNIFTKLKNKGKYIVGYTGAHALANALDSFIRAAHVLKENNRIHFVMVGQGQEKERLMKLAKSLDCENVSFLPPVAKTFIPGVLEKMDACYIGFQRQPLFQYGVSPNKLMDYMMAAKPIINAIDAGNDLVSESGCGITVTPENPEATAEAINSIAELSSEARNRIGRKGNEYVRENHDYRVLARRFIERL